jgi:copper chaperone NosL
LWLYDYGHNLNPQAAIKMPGQAYMPPVFGTKQILNFTAHSYPMLGSFFLLVGICLSPAAFYFSLKEERKNKN